MKLISLTQGKFAQVDDEDYDYLMQWKWFAIKGIRTYYAMRCLSRKGREHKENLFMHRLLLGLGWYLIDKRMGDHIDHNGLNNQRCNIRIATGSTNQANRKYTQVTGYRGVQPRNNGEGYGVYISKDGVRYYLGYTKDIHLAAEMYNQAAIKYFGEFATLNVIKK